MRVLLFGPPLIQLIIFGYAVNLDVGTAPASPGWTWTGRPPAATCALPSKARGASRSWPFRPTTPKSSDLLDRRPGAGVVRDAARLRARSRARRHRPVQVLVDGTNSNTASIVSSYAGQIVAAFSSRAARRAAARQAGRQHAGRGRAGRPGRTARRRAQPRLVQPGPAQPRLLRARRGGQHHHAGDADADRHGHRAREGDRHHGAVDGDAHPPDRADARQDAALCPVSGCSRSSWSPRPPCWCSTSPSAATCCCCCSAPCLFLLTTLGVGLFISTICRTQQQAMMSSFFFFTPAFMLSGFAFPIRNMPLPVQ